MTEHPPSIRIGTRGSALARWQANHIAEMLRAVHPGLRVEVAVITTRGDRVLDTPLPLIGGKGLFTAELEAALRSGEIDLAVHSLKDLPTDDPEGLVIGAIPRRADVQDVLVSRMGLRLDALPAGATVGTSSRRRAAQLLAHRPDLAVVDIRGNVDTRLRKVLDPHSSYDAVVLAQAGIERLGRADAVTQALPLDVMLPAPGQGALGIQCRHEGASLTLLEPLNHAETQVAVTAERAFLAGLGGGCTVPVAAYATSEAGMLRLRGRVMALDGSRRIEVSAERLVGAAAGHSLAAARTLGYNLAHAALAQGADAMLKEAE